MSKNKINIIFLKKYRIICLRKIYITNAISFSLSFSMTRIILPYLSFQLCSNSSYFPNFKFSPSLQFCNFIFPSFNIYLISFFFLFLTDPNRWSSTRVALWFSWWQNRKPLSPFFSLSLSLSLSLSVFYFILVASFDSRVLDTLSRDRLAVNEEIYVARASLKFVINFLWQAMKWLATFWKIQNSILFIVIYCETRVKIIYRHRYAQFMTTSTGTDCH